MIKNKRLSAQEQVKQKYPLAFCEMHGQEGYQIVSPLPGGKLKIISSGTNFFKYRAWWSAAKNISREKS